MKNQILIRRTVDRYTVTLTPYLKPSCLASGELTFAVWQCWKNEGEAAIAEAESKAIQSAREALAIIAREAGGIEG